MTFKQIYNLQPLVKISGIASLKYTVEQEYYIQHRYIFINYNIDILAKIINNVLIEDYKALITQSYSAKFPTALCRYMYLMETKVYKQDTIIQQTAVGINTCFKYFEE